MSDLLDVVLDVPRNLFDLHTGDLFLEAAKIIISEEMSCRDDDGEQLVIDRVNIEMVSHGDEAHFNTDLIIEIGGIDYADRMGNIRDRLKAIRWRIRALPPANKTFSLRFNPRRKDCWLEFTDE